MRTLIYILCMLWGTAAHSQMVAVNIPPQAQAFIDRGLFNERSIINFYTDAGTTQAQLRRGTYMCAIVNLTNNFLRFGIWDSSVAFYPVLVDTLLNSFNTSRDDLFFAYTRARFNLKGTSNTLLQPTNGARPFATINGFHFGELFNGNSTKWFNTQVPQNFNGNYNIGLSYYSTRDVPSVSSADYRVEIGSSSNFTNNDVRLLMHYNRQSYVFAGQSSIGAVSTVNATTVTTGLFSGNRTASNNLSISRNGTQLAQNTTNNTSSPTTLNLVIGGNNENGTINGFTNRTCGYARIGQGLSAVGVQREYESVNQYFTILGRPTF